MSNTLLRTLISEMVESYLEEKTIRAYKDWKSLYNEVKNEKNDNIVQYILDNTEDERSKDKVRKHTYDKDYVKSVEDWVKKQKGA